MSELFKRSDIELTAVTSEDLNTIVSWYQHSSFTELYDTDPSYPKNRKRLEADFLTNDSTSYLFAIRKTGRSAPIGLVGLHDIEWNNQVGALSIGIGEMDERGKGYGTSALEMLLTFAFLELNLHKLVLDVIDYNQEAIRLYHSVGFQVEGELKEMVYRHNQRYSKIVMGLSRSEWLQRQD